MTDPAPPPPDPVTTVLREVGRILTERTPEYGYLTLTFRGGLLSSVERSEKFKPGEVTGPRPTGKPAARRAG